jgi:hypothetical protein
MEPGFHVCHQGTTCAGYPQVEYFRQRQAVLLELQSAKAEAEAERQRILAKIGSTLANSRWRA